METPDKAPLLAPVSTKAKSGWGDRVENFVVSGFPLNLQGFLSVIGAMMPLLAVAIYARIITKPAVVRVRNLEPVDCLDIKQYVESFQLRGIPYRDEFDAAMRGLVAKHPPSSFQFVLPARKLVTLGGQADYPHDLHPVLCWYESKRSADRLAELRLAYQAMNARIETSPHTPDERIASSKRWLASSSYHDDRFLIRQLDAVSAVFSLTQIASKPHGLDLKEILGPSERSKYSNSANWEDEIEVSAAID